MRKFLVIPLLPLAIVGAAVALVGRATIDVVLLIGLTKKERTDMQFNRLVMQLAAFSEG